mmetsp:Transcript_99530/g.249530  ORF Transcript_99530/g.249530 Transcript_99530/m.249530 type:complete len:325 (+) Transcript_99530:509-1483(+)
MVHVEAPESLLDEAFLGQEPPLASCCQELAIVQFAVPSEVQLAEQLLGRLLRHAEVFLQGVDELVHQDRAVALLVQTLELRLEMVCFIHRHGVGDQAASRSLDHVGGREGAHVLEHLDADLLGLTACPLREPPVASSDLRRRPFPRVPCQHRAHKVLAILAEAVPLVGVRLEGGHAHDLLHDVLVRVHEVAEGRLAGEELEHRAGDRPHVGLRGVVHGAVEHLRRHVGRRADEVAAGVHLRGEAEVYQLQVRHAPGADAPREHHVLRLDVSVHDASGVAAARGNQQLLDQPGCPTLGERVARFLQEARTVPAGDVLQDEDQPVL